MVLGGAAPGVPMFLLEAAAGREQKESWKRDTLLSVLLMSCHLESVMWGQEQGDILCCWVPTQEPQPQPRETLFFSFGLAAAWVLSEIRTSGIEGFEGESKR